jgi:hypothetical protein
MLREVCYSDLFMDLHPVFRTPILFENYVYRGRRCKWARVEIHLATACALEVDLRRKMITLFTLLIFICLLMA